MICAEHITEKERLGYLAWMERANQDHRKGRKQRRCSECRRYYFSWELKEVPKEKRA